MRWLCFSNGKLWVGFASMMSTAVGWIYWVMRSIMGWICLLDRYSCEWICLYDEHSYGIDMLV
jgi:hypothetical protein